MMHMHPFEIQPAQGGRFGWFIDRNQDNPTAPFVVYNRDGRRVAIPAGDYTWWQNALRVPAQPERARDVDDRAYRIGNYYDGDFKSLEITSDYRFTLANDGQRSAGRGRTSTCRSARSSTNLVPIKASYSFTPLASLSALVQYNGQTAQFSSNVRLALLNRSGTGLFVVYNDRRDTTRFTPLETLGRSFVVKYTRLFDF